eukprot:jgi/Chlat1/699/Chrsp104S01163
MFERAMGVAAAELGAAATLVTVSVRSTPFAGRTGRPCLQGWQVRGRRALRSSIVSSSAALESGQVGAAVRMMGDRGSGPATTSAASSGNGSGRRGEPKHLIVLAHGLAGTPEDWNYACKEMTSRMGDRAIIHVSRVNGGRSTFNGVDVAGKRLAEEIRDVVRQHPALQRLTLIGHSLGGLFVRYAAGALYEPSDTWSESDRGRIAGLVPYNFVTLATPHLGSVNQVPFLPNPLQGLAGPVAPLLFGRTGRHLFLRDKDGEKDGRDLPLLARMATDCSEAPFISALGSFQSRVVYANAGMDHLVGWATSAILRENELPPLPALAKDADKSYKFVALEEKPQIQIVPEREYLQRVEGTTPEEVTLRQLQKLPFHRVHVSFKGAVIPYFAHYHIQVRRKWLNSEGKGVVQHLIDSLATEKQTLTAAL